MLNGSLPSEFFPYPGDVPGRFPDFHDAPRTQDENRFWAVYDRLAETGSCDCPGGAEYDRVFHEWCLCGKPNDLEDFIQLRANWWPEDPGEIAFIDAYERYRVPRSPRPLPYLSSSAECRRLLWHWKVAKRPNIDAYIRTHASTGDEEVPHA